MYAQGVAECNSVCRLVKLIVKVVFLTQVVVIMLVLKYIAHFSFTGNPLGQRTYCAPMLHL